MTQRLRPALERALGTNVVGIVRVGGGSINEAYEVHLDDGRRLFAKSHPSPPPDFFAVESAALAWLGDARALRVPTVVAAEDCPVAFLALEWVEPGHRTATTDEALGRGLAAMHRTGAPGWGWDRDGYVGDLPQPNASRPTWAAFYGERRLLPVARRAVEAGALPGSVLDEVHRLADRLPQLVGADEAPARLHGDLWGGNLLIGRGGIPWLIDPAPYGGHREIDLAMMRLFGGFGLRVFDAYAEAWPLSEGHEDRVALYQLYPLLVHAVVFGAGYAAQTMAALHHYR